jgi:hypothetical protein
MVKHVVAGLVIVLASAAAFAQTPQPTAAEAALRARQRISSVEAVLERAISNGADSVIEQVSSIVGDQPRLLGAPRARGFRLPESGVIFYVDVPSLTLPLLWPVRHLVDDARQNLMVAELQVLAAQLEPPQRRQLENLIAKMQPATPGQSPDRLRQNVGAASLAPEGARVVASPPMLASRAAAPSLDDPEDAYRKAVKAQLIDAMLESPALGIGPDEMLTVAARSNVPRDPLFPGDTVASTTWIASVKGSDLAAYRAGTITAEQARGRVRQIEQ